MIRSLVVRFRALSLFAVLLATAVVASCSEDIQGGSACPALCPQDAPPKRDTTIDAVTFDTSLSSFPPLGFEPTLLLARFGDTVDARIVTRYDTLPELSGTDSIKQIDSAYITGHRLAADSLLKIKDTAAVEVYDVTDAAGDTVTAALLAQFTPANLIGTRQYVGGDKPDTLKIFLDTGRVHSRIHVDHRLHIALRMVTKGSEQIRVISQNGGQGFALTVRTSPDTTVAAQTVQPSSDFPADRPFLTAAMADFQLVALAPPMAANTLRIGGMPWQRALLRFHIPSRIVDSTEVIRATLSVTQRPVGPNAGDSVKVYVVPVIVSSRVADFHTILEFAGSPASLAFDSVTVFPGDSLRRSLQVVHVIQSWRGQDTTKTPRTIALTLATEGVGATAVDFYSITAAAGLRPQLHITYITKLNTGRP
jgi:hypothetical protein